MSVLIRPASPPDTGELARVAAATFALACPPGAPQADIAAFIDDHLSADSFAEYLADPKRQLAVAVSDGEVIGYTMLNYAAPAEDLAGQLTTGSTAELSKIYVQPSHHGGVAARALLENALASVRESGRAAIWLGTNQANGRAQRFYEKHRFVRVGTRRFRLGSHWEDDFIYELRF